MNKVTAARVACKAAAFLATTLSFESASPYICKFMWLILCCLNKPLSCVCLETLNKQYHGTPPCPSYGQEQGKEASEFFTALLRALWGSGGRRNWAWSVWSQTQQGRATASGVGGVSRWEMTETLGFMLFGGPDMVEDKKPHQSHREGKL